MSNSRKAFRIDMYDKDCIVSNDYHTTNGFIKDVSDIGMGVEVNADLFDKVCEVHFELDNKEFYKSCRIVRRKPLNSGKVFLALEFEQDRKGREELFQRIIRIDAIRARQKGKL